MNKTLARFVPQSDLPIAVDCSVCAKPTKCCSFQPFIPNFLLGAFLDRLPDFPNAVFQPIGMIPTPEYRSKREAMGEVEELMCSFFDKSSRSCSIYDYRPGECSTYYCDSVVREKFSGHVQAIETAIAQMALVELGFGSDEISRQVDVINGAPPEYIHEDLLVMYKKAWKWSESLSAEEVNSWK